jgi:hypothetical protein
VLNLERIRRIYGIVIDPALMTVDGPGMKKLRANQPRSTADRPAEAVFSKKG